MEQIQPLSALVGRILLASMFIMAGFQKIGVYGGTQQYMEAFGVPGSLLPLVILTEIGAGLLIAAGLFTRLAALALAGFAILAALTFHRDFADQVQMLFFVKNLAIAGGLLLLVAFGPGALSLDRKRVG
ncbi:MAG: DoxX family protein [Alphaproteobacteria bacterium]